MPKGVYTRRRENFIGEKNNFYGRKHSLETKIKISQKQGGNYQLFKCLVCDNQFHIAPARLKEYKNRGQFCSLKCKRVGIKMPSGKDHPNWKENDVGYSGLHTWVKKKLGKPDRCDNSDCVYPRIGDKGRIMKKPKIYHWANKSGQYKRNLNDWIRLCCSCHKLYDNGKLEL